MGYDYVFDSEKPMWGSLDERVEIDSEAKPQVSILFEKEGVVLHADCHGNSFFCDIDGNVIHEDKAEANSLFSSVRVCVGEDKIIAKFPVTKWIDHYPNCDGEYDRWSEVIVDTICIYCPIQ